MTTFTLQELNLPTTQEEAIKTLEQVAKEKWMEYGMNHPISANLMNEETLINMGKALANHEIAHQQAQQNLLDAVPPQPSEGTNVPLDLPSIINNICTQLQLLATVITSSQDKTTGENSLQECVSLTLQQADWFKDLIRHELVALDISEIAKDAVEDIVENEVESYFENNFDPSYHFDFDDAVHDAVGDRIDDVVSDKIDDALDSYMSNATITINK